MTTRNPRKIRIEDFNRYKITQVIASSSGDDYLKRLTVIVDPVATSNNDNVWYEVTDSDLIVCSTKSFAKAIEVYNSI